MDSVDFFGNRNTHCARCGRALTNPTSVASGYGPVCRAKVGAREPSEYSGKTFTDEHDATPLDSGIVIRRNEEAVFTNVPHLIVDHSPDGFEFGYGGSGPADLALNIIEVVLRREGYQGEIYEPSYGRGHCFKDAYYIHQEFKWKFIASIPREKGATLDYNEVRDWILERASRRHM